MLHTLEVVSVTSEDAGQYSAYISNAAECPCEQNHQVKQK